MMPAIPSFFVALRRFRLPGEPRAKVSRPGRHRKP